jgi:NAD-dependent dihydropyrimidine dehydrogenase PreA subunit
MAYIITDACIDVKDQSCVQECPVDCILTKEGETQFYIDPEICIDCGACQPVCPVNAIYPADELPPDQEHQIEKNADFFRNLREQEAGS